MFIHYCTSEGSSLLLVSLGPAHGLQRHLRIRQMRYAFVILQVNLLVNFLQSSFLILLSSSVCLLSLRPSHLMFMEMEIYT